MVGDVAHSQGLELGVALATGEMQGEENGPGDEASDKANVAQDLDEAQEEEAIEGAMVQHHGIGNAKKGHDPVEPAVGQLRCGRSEVELMGHCIFMLRLPASTLTREPAGPGWCVGRRPGGSDGVQ